MRLLQVWTEWNKNNPMPLPVRLQYRHQTQEVSTRQAYQRPLRQVYQHPLHQQPLRQPPVFLMPLPVFLVVARLHYPLPVRRLLEDLLPILHNHSNRHLDLDRHLDRHLEHLVNSPLVLCHHSPMLPLIPVCKTLQHQHRPVQHHRLFPLPRQTKDLNQPVMEHSTSP